MKGRPLDLVGSRFDRLVVVAMAGGTKSGRAWLCRCDCGNTVQKMTTQLRRKSRAYGGCRECESISRAMSHLKHAGALGGKSPLYDRWKGMRQRCNDKNGIGWKYYGGKGVRICPQWESFAEFREWSETHGYAPGLSLDRLDPNGNYSPENCEWVTRSENSRRAHRAHRQKALG